MLLPSIYQDDEITKQREHLEERRWKKDRINEPSSTSSLDSGCILSDDNDECSMKSESKHQIDLMWGGIKNRPENFEEPQQDTSTSTHSSYSSKNKKQLEIQTCGKRPKEKNKKYTD